MYLKCTYIFVVVVEMYMYVLVITDNEHIHVHLKKIHILIKLAHTCTFKKNYGKYNII